MAKIFKFTGYYIDPDGVYTVDDVIEALEERNIDILQRHISAEEADIGKWDDDHPLNMCDCPVAECKKYFEKPAEIQPAADVAPVVHGRDIWSEHDGHCEFKCRLCGAYAIIVEGGPLDGGKFAFCPHCGAKMDGGADADELQAKTQL